MAETSEQLLSVDEFAAKIKKKYPVYDKIDNRELTDKIIAKYPQYKEHIRFDETPKAEALPVVPTRSKASVTPRNVVDSGVSYLRKSLTDLDNAYGEALGVANKAIEAPAATQPLSKTMGGYTAQEAIDDVFPDFPKSPIYYDMPRRALRTAAGLFDWAQTPLGIATSIAHATLHGADSVIAPVLGMKFGSDAVDAGRSALKDMEKNGATPENVEQYLGAWSMGLFGLAGAKSATTPRPEVKIPTKVELKAIADEANRIKEKEGVRLERQARKAKESADRRIVVEEAKTRAAGKRADETIARAPAKTSTGEPTAIEGKPRDTYTIMEEEAKRQIEDSRKRELEASQKAEEGRLKVTDRRAGQGAVEETERPTGQTEAKKEELPPVPTRQTQPVEKRGILESSGEPGGAISDDKTPRTVKEKILKNIENAEADKQKITGKQTDQRDVSTSEKRTKKSQTKAKERTDKLPEPPKRSEEPKTPYQHLVDDTVHSYLAGVSDFFRSGVTETIGKVVGRDPERGSANYGTETTRRAGVNSKAEDPSIKDQFPFLKDIKEAPGLIAKAVERGKGPLFDRLVEATREWVLANEGEDIQHALDAASPEDIKEMVGDRPTQGLLEASGEGIEFKEGESKSELGRTEKEGLSKLAGGRRAELLKEGKTFDETRLVDSELFAGRGGPQKGMFEEGGESAKGGSNAATAFPSKVRQNVESRAREAVDSFRTASDDIRKTFVPGSRGESARTAGGLLRNTLADVAKRDSQAAAAISDARGFFQRLREYLTGVAPFNTGARAMLAKPDVALDFIDRIETGQRQVTPELQRFADTMKSMREDMWKEVQARGGPKTWIDNYWVHMWKDPAKAESQLARYYARRPLLGAKDFLHKREIPTVKFGIEELGLEPAFANPVDAWLTQMHQLHKYVLMKDMVEEAKQLGVLQFKGVFDTKPMTGMVRINDPVGTISGPPYVTVREAYDENMFSQINDFARSLGIKAYTKTQMRGGMWGYTRKGENAVYRRFGGPESVLTHEIGHQLDFRYGLADRLVKNPATRDELRALADMRYEGKENLVSPSYKRYVRRGTEKIANLVHALVHAPERAAEVAPNSVQALRELAMFHPEIRPLFDIKPSMVLGENAARQPVGGQVVLGHLYAPEPAARILNNYLAPGLAGHPLYDVVRYGSNLTNMAQLGFSAFHLTFTAMDSAVSTAALGIQQFTEGKFGKGLINIGKSVIPFEAPLENLVRGSRVLKEYTKPGSQGEFYARTVEQLTRGGGRVSMDKFYHDNAIQSFWEAFHAGKAITPLKAVPALIEAVAKPIMSYWVPRQKLGIFAKLAEHEMEVLGPNASTTDVRAAMGRAWDSVDNRMGQMVYDNLFWKRSLKDLGLISVRSLGWNLGTFRELGMAVLSDYPKAFARRGEAFRSGRFHMTPRMAYTLALPFVVGMYGAMTHYLMNGKGPEEIRDYFFIPTGRKNPDGTPERISLPSYMKDVFQYKHDFPYGAIETLEHKANPDISMIFDMLRNEDFYGVKIRNEDDPAVQQVGQLMKYIGSNFLPFSVRNAEVRSEANASSIEQAESFFGILPAPKWVDRSPAEQFASKKVAAMLPRGARTQAEADRGKLRGQLIRDFQAKKPSATVDLQKAIRSGKLTTRDATTIRQDVSMTYLQRQVQRVGLIDALDTWDRASEKEKDEIRPIVLKKAALIRNMPQEMQAQLTARIRQIANRDKSSEALPEVPSRGTLNTPFQNAH